MQVWFCEVGAAGAEEKAVELKAGAVVGDLLKTCARTLKTGEAASVWGRRVDEAHPLREGDRVVVAAPLLVDPKEARRLRAERQGDVRVVTCGRHGGRHRRL